VKERWKELWKESEKSMKSPRMELDSTCSIVVASLQCIFICMCLRYPPHNINLLSLRNKRCPSCWFYFGIIWTGCPVSNWWFLIVSTLFSSLGGRIQISSVLWTLNCLIFHCRSILFGRLVTGVLAIEVQIAKVLRGWLKGWFRPVL